MEINLIRPQVKTKSGIKTDKRLLHTKCAIVSALIELLCEKDLSDITVTELTSRAQVNRKTFYLHYDKIEDIIEDFEEDLLAFGQDILRRSVKPSKGTVDPKLFFQVLNSAIEDNLAFFKLFVRSGTYRIFISSAIRRKYISGLRVSLGGQLGNKPSSPYIAEYIASGVSSMYAKWLCAEIPSVSLQVLSEQAYELVHATLAGIGEAHEQR